MKILWQSNAPHCNSGYGTVTANVVKRLKDYHDINVFAYWGLKGGMLDWNGVKVYPNDPEDWGNALVEKYFKETQSDITISLMDVWVLNQNVYKNVNWIPYFPLDHDSIPLMVKEHLTARKFAITMSKYGQSLCEKEGIESVYIPHGVETDIYKPDNDVRGELRGKLNLNGKFVIGTVAANKGERKNFTAMLDVFARFHKLHPDSAFLVSTNPHDRSGIVNMPEYCKYLGIENDVIFPSAIRQARGSTSYEMNAFYNAMDVFMLLSKGEGFGIPILEAQSCGIPVIVTDFSAMTELCGSGWKVPYNNLKFTYQNACQAEVDQDKALEALEEAYYIWQFKAKGYNELRNNARGFAIPYDYDTVVKDYWLPALELIGREVV